MRHLYVALILLSPLGAQKVPDPIDSAREVQVYDARAALDGIDGIDAIEGEPETSEILALHRRDRLEDLVMFLRAALVPMLRDPDDLQRLGGDLLVLRGAPAQQVALQRFLRRWSVDDLDRIFVVTRIVRVPQQVFRESIAPTLGLQAAADKDSKAVSPLVLELEQAAGLELALKQGVGIEVVDSPRLLLLPGQHGTVSRWEKVYYRKDYLVEIENDKVKVWPVTGTIEDGVAVDVRAAPVDAETTAVAVSLNHTDLERPMPTFETTIGVTRKVVIDLPAFTVRRLSGVLRLKPGQVGVLVGGGGDDGQRTLVLVQCGDS